MYKIIIAFVGNDGSGKTYQAAKIFQQLKRDGSSVKLIHFNHIFLKIPKFASSNTYLSIEGQENQSIKLFNVLKANRLFGLIFPIVAYLDFLVFYYRHVIFSFEKIIIFDRYFIDKLIKFYDLGICNEKLFFLILKITPLPTLAIYLDVSAEVSFRRKQELTIPLLNRRRTLYKKVAGISGFITINAEREKGKIFSEIMEKLNAR